MRDISVLFGESRTTVQQLRNFGEVLQQIEDDSP
jgi:hypothetical protein